jgi:hypothetical protein
MKKNAIIKLSAFLVISIGFIFLIIFYSNALPYIERNKSGSITMYHNGSVSDSEGIIEKTFKVEPDGILKVETDIAQIHINSWDKNEVKVIVRKEGNEDRFKNYNVTFSSTPQKVEVYGKYDKDFWNWGRFSVHFEITVPKSFNLDLDNSAGDIKVRETKGKVKINSSAGNIILSDVIGDVNIDNSAGYIELNSVDGKIRASTSAGNIKAYSINENKGIDLETSAGNIQLYVTETTKADLFASTSIGNVDIHVNNAFTGDIDGNDINGKLNGGGEKIKLNTSIGNISISLKK